jgi:hypothetical protein
MTTVVRLLDMLEGLGSVIISLLDDLPNSAELRAETLARLIVLQAKLSGWERFQKELDATVPR